LIAALFTTAKVWKQCKCLSKGKWIKKMWYVHTTVYYSAIKRNEILSFVTRVDLECIIVSKISQTEKDRYRM
ncbi:LORF2 protein, partial [Crocuta crocuta]